VTEIGDPDDVPASKDNTLEQIIFEQVGAKPMLLIDGGTGGGDKAQKAAFRRRYLRWVRNNLKFIPTSCPEELILRAARKIKDESARPSQEYKDQLHEEADANLGYSVSSEDTDKFGQVLLGQHRTQSPELVQLKELLETFLKSVKLS
jgi:hypothetical protein